MYDRLNPAHIVILLGHDLKNHDIGLVDTLGFEPCLIGRLLGSEIRLFT